MDDEWLARYEVGENNSGRPVEQRAKGIITAEEGNRFTVAQEETADIFGRYRVTIGERCFDTVALAESENGIWIIQYLNRKDVPSCSAGIIAMTGNRNNMGSPGLRNCRTAESI